MILRTLSITSSLRARLLAASLCLTLASCSELVRQQAQVPADWDATHQRLAAIDAWRLSARMAMQTTQQGGSLDVFWTQAGERFDIRLIAPLGQGAVQLTGDGTHVDARFADGQQLAGDPAALLEQHFGVRVPVAALVYWLRGLAADGDYRRASWDEQQRLHSVSQYGWRVEMRDYQPSAGYLLPTRFYLEQEQDQDVNLRFLVRRWQVGS